MTVADKVTSLRLVLAPFFFVVYLLPGWLPAWSGVLAPVSVPVLWVLFVVSEISDLLDGKIARARHTVSDFGKLYDPFADTLVRITYFLCFSLEGVLPVILLVVVLYREFGIQFLRVLMMQKGIAMGARWGGKIKAVTYMAAGALALGAVSIARLGLDAVFPSPVSLYFCFRLAACVVFALSVLIAILSFIDYAVLYQRAGKK
ncbi:MAG: CDP-diacylglycerol--glycerol-3-phosphate 3-phosphatidyltransferase [Spirochaetaceae bacterium]|jgi:CDP-diacylglycerol--glycerol-3-phosphate 3-phosphatidyltransferase|nr:CDP-diacylglycerol--glycerol-3-phosphate 3-phosphatidyltransferase [Spirochaetaceae bacterium]